MNAEEITKLINILPNVIIYIVPGFIFIQVYNYIMNLKGKDLKSYLMEYILSSYLIIITIKFVCFIFDYDFNTYDNINQIVICIISLFLSYIIAIFLKSEAWIIFMNFVYVNRSNSSNIFNDIIDNDLGTWVRVYIASEKLIYDGAFIKFEYKGSYQESFIVLADYITYKYGDGNVDNDWLKENSDKLEHVAIKVSDINRIEATYSENSKKLIKSNDMNVFMLLRKGKNFISNKKHSNNESTLDN